MPSSTRWIAAIMLIAAVPSVATAQNVLANSRQIGPVPRAEAAPLESLLRVEAGLDVVDAPLPETLHRLGESSGVPVAYSPAFLPVDRTVTCRCEDLTLGEAVATVLAGIPFEMVAVRGQLVIRELREAASPLRLSGVALRMPDLERLEAADRRSTDEMRPPPPVQGTITGRVVDAQTREPLGEVQVYIPGTDFGTLTGAAGRFILLNIPPGPVTVRAERIGYLAAEETVQVTEGGSTALNFELATTQIGLEELVVSVEAQQQRRREMGTDIGTINVERSLAQGAVQTMSGLLQARTTGISVTGGSGMAGAGSRIRVRGPTSLTQENDPLLVIDGVRVSNETTLGTSATSGGGTSRFDDLNPNEIENIQVIKGPAATALYGSEAAPGVIVVTTKRGQSGEPRITLSTRFGLVQNQWDYPDNYSNVTDFFGVTDLDDPRISGFPAEQNPVTGEVFITHNPFENPDTRPFQRGNVQEYGISATGGGDRFNYLTSINYSTEQGVVKSNFYDRLNLRGNVDFEVAENLTVGARLGIVDARRQYPQDNSTGSGLGVNGFLGSPIAAFGSDGVCARDALLEVEPGTTGWCEGREGNFGMPFSTMLEMVEQGEDVFRSISSLNLQWGPTEWLNNRLTIGLDRVERDRYDLWFFDPTGISRVDEGSVTERRYTTELITADYTATVTGSLGERIRRWTTFGGQLFLRSTEWVICDGEEFPNDEVTSCNAAFISSGESGLVEQEEAGAFLQQRFGFDEYAFLTGAIRVDDNASLGADVGAIWSPSVNASLVVSEMPFWNIDKVNNLRVRAAYGTASQSPDPYSADQTFQAAPVTIGGQLVGGITPENPGNPELGPERSEELEIGFDAGLFNDRMGVTFTYYNIDIRDLIVPQPVAPSSGFPGSRLVNLGLMENSGIELSLQGDLIRKSNFQWNLQINHSQFDPVITDLGLDAPIFFPTGADGGSRAAGSQVFQTGFAPGAYVSQVVSSATRDENGNITGFELAPGNLGDGSDRRVVGSPWPDAEQSLRTSFTLYRNLTISALFDRVAGADLLNVTRAFRTPFVTTPGGSAFGREYAMRHTHSPEHQAMIENSFFGAFIEDGDYIKFRELNIAYTLPERWVSRFGAESVRANLAGRNLVTWTPFSILEPETDVQGSRDNFIRNNFASTFAQMRTFWFGLNVTF